MQVIAFDCETFPIRKGLAAPPPVCLGWAHFQEGAELLAKGLVTSRGETWGDVFQGASTFREWVCALWQYAMQLGPDELRIVNVNIVYDWAVLASGEPPLQDGVSTLLDLIFDLYDHGFVEDPMLREQLIDIAKGHLGWSSSRKTAKGSSQRMEYSLAELVQEYFGVDLDKDTWRLGYGKLADVPLAKWAQGAIDYGVDDAVWAGKVWFAQRAAVIEEGAEDGEVPDSRNQAKYHWGLHLTSVWGIRTDPKEVFSFKRLLQKASIRLLSVLKQVRVVTSGSSTCDHSWVEGKKGLQVCVKCSGTRESFIRPTGQKNTNAIKSAVLELCARKGLTPALTKTGVQKRKEWEVLPEPERSKALKKYTATDADTISDLLEVFHLKRPKDLEGALEAADAAEQREPDTFDGLSLFSWYVSVEKLLTTYIPTLETGTRVPINAKYRCLVESGRTSCSKPNLQNLPKAPGVRECYIPRPGFLFCSVDYEALELHTLAQVCLELLGESALADALNAGLDPHLLMACEWLLDGVTYEEGKKIRKDESHPRHKEVVKARNMAKCFHPDTEFLTKRGWRKFDELAPGEEIAQATPRAGQTPEITWAVPFNLFRERRDTLIHLKNEGIDLRVTDDHRMLAFNAKKEPLVCTPEELQKKRGWWNAGNLPDTETSVEIDEDILRLAVAIQADGSYKGRGVVEFGFSKERKQQRLAELIDRIAEKRLIQWHLRQYSNESMGDCLYFKLSGPAVEDARALLDEDKTLPWSWLNLTLKCREAVLDEARFWDSHTPPRGVAYSYCTTKHQNAEVLQALATITGRKTRQTREERVNAAHADTHSVTIRTKCDTRGGELSAERIENPEGDVVCLSVPSSYVVVRDGGVAVIAGQCANFGLPGGLGAERFVEFCKASGILMTLEEAKQLKEAWLQQWPEMRRYFQHIKKLLEVDDEEDLQYVTVEQVFSQRIRGKARYTAACNSYFQGLAADGAKLAVYELAKACYKTGGSLYGSRMVVFIHDETIMEHPNLSREDLHARCEEQARIMVECMKLYTPDVRPKAEPALMGRWYKDATKKLDEDGYLMAWEPQPAAA